MYVVAKTIQTVAIHGAVPHFRHHASGDVQD